MRIATLMIVFAGMLLYGCCCALEEELSSPILQDPYGLGDEGASSGYSQLQSTNYWGATSPLTLEDWTYKDDSLFLVVTNTDASKIILTDISIDGTSVYSENMSLGAGDFTTVLITMPQSCGYKGDPFELEDVRLTYSKGAVSGLQQVGSLPIIGTCS